MVGVFAEVAGLRLPAFGVPLPRPRNEDGPAAGVLARPLRHAHVAESLQLVPPDMRIRQTKVLSIRCVPVGSAIMACNVGWVFAPRSPDVPAEGFSLVTAYLSSASKNRSGRARAELAILVDTGPVEMLGLVKSRLVEARSARGREDFAVGIHQPVNCNHPQGWVACRSPPRVP